MNVLLNEPVPRNDIERLRLENARLRTLVVDLSQLVLRNIVTPGVQTSTKLNAAPDAS